MQFSTTMFGHVLVTQLASHFEPFWAMLGPFQPIFGHNQLFSDHFDHFGMGAILGAIYHFEPFGGQFRPVLTTFWKISANFSKLG